MPRRINLTIDGVRRKQGPAPIGPDPDVVWPTMLEDDAPSIRMFDFKFFRGDTKWDAENNQWITIPEWTGALSEKGIYRYSDSTMRAHANVVEDIDFRYMGNEFVLTKEQIQAEYGSDVQDRFNRMPLQIVTEREADDKRWTMFAGGINARLRLLSSNDVSKPKFDVSPDLIKDSSKKGPWRFVDQTDPTLPDEYKIAGVVIGKYGLELKEIGTKSVCHYIDQGSQTGSPLSYGIDWLDPEGLFICPFNTLDTDNYKVTLEPDYEADAVDGRILMASGLTKVEIHLMFRRWAHYCRLAQIQMEHVTGSPTEYVYVEACSSSYDGLCGSCALLECSNPFVNDACEKYRQSCGGDPDGNWELVDCVRTASDEALYRDEQGMCHNWSSSSSCAWVDGGCHQTNYETYDSDPFSCEDPVWAHCSTSVANTYKLTLSGGAYRYFGNSYVGLWWGPPPVDFYLPSLGDKEREAAFIYKPSEGGDDTSLTLDLVGDESYDDAVQHFLASGGDETLVGEIIGGYNSIHFFAPARWPRMLVTNPWSSEDIREHLNRFCSTADGKLLKQETAGIRTYNGTEDKLSALWQHFYESEFFQSYYAVYPSLGYWWPTYLDVESGYCTKRPYVDIPYGLGLSPMKEGTLCAVIKVRNKPFYVWRKTDEVFTERYLHVTGPEITKPFATFDGAEMGPGYEFYVHFSGDGRKNTHILTSKQAVCNTYAHYGLEDPYPNDPIEGCEKILPFIEVGPGQVELESPVYPFLSRERAAIGSNQISQFSERLFRDYVFETSFNTEQRDKY